MFDKIKKLSENDKIVLANVSGAFLVKGLGLIVSMLTLPAYMRFFSNQQVLGVWYTVLSVLSWILNFDLGIGNGLRNHLTIALQEKNNEKIKKYVSSAYIMIGKIVIPVMVVCLFFSAWVDWNAIFNISPLLVSSEDLLFVVRCALIGILAQFFFRLISSILYALQYSAVNNAIALATSVLQLIVALIAPNYGAVYSLRMFSFLNIFCTNVPLIVATAFVFVRVMPYAWPSFKYYESSTARSVLSLGGMFFICQILYMCIANTNEFLITNYYGPENVVDYQVYNRIFTLSSTVVMLALTPVWSAVSKAMAEKDYVWLKKLLKYLNGLALLAIVGEFLLVFIAQPFADIWLGGETIRIDYKYALYFALFGSVMLYQSMISTFTNGLGRMKIQAICYSVGVLFKFLIIHFGSQYFAGWGIVVLSNGLILIPYCIIQYFDISRLINAKCLENE